MLSVPVKTDYEALLRNLRRRETPARVQFMELFWDGEIERAVWERFDLGRDLPAGGPDYARRRWIRVPRFLGYDYVRVRVAGLGAPRTDFVSARDTAAPAEGHDRAWSDYHTGPIRTKEDLARYRWPELADLNFTDLDWYVKHLPDDMCILTDVHGPFEWVFGLMGFEQLAFALHDDPELVDELFTRVGRRYVAQCEALAQCPRVEIVFGMDDLGHRTGTLISSRVLKEQCLVWHRAAAEAVHRQGKLYLLHACGNLESLMPDLIEEVKLDGKHSFEDAIEPVTVAKARWGDRLSLIGGLDVDLLCRANEETVRRQVRETLEVCLPGGGYCLGTGNSVANYVPVQNYLAMLDEGRRYAG